MITAILNSGYFYWLNDFYYIFNVKFIKYLIYLFLYFNFVAELILKIITNENKSLF